MPKPIGRFVAYDIAPVAEFDDRGCAPQPSINEARLQSDCTFWSLYGITPDGTSMCIGDYCDYERCAEVYTRITGCIVPENADGLRLTSLRASA